MKMKYAFALSILFFLVFSSCKKSNFVEKKAASGAISERYQVNDSGQKNGSYESFDEEGNKIEVSLYRNDHLDGLRTIYHKSGHPEIEETYLNDIIVGDYKVYYDTGVLSLEVPYVAGTMSGLLKKYNEGGILTEEVTMANNNENGPFKEYYTNGQVKWEGTYLDGDNEFGLLQQYNKEGTLIKKMMCDSLAVCTTTWSIGE